MQGFQQADEKKMNEPKR